MRLRRSLIVGGLAVVPLLYMSAHEAENEETSAAVIETPDGPRPSVTLFGGPVRTDSRQMEPLRDAGTSWKLEEHAARPSAHKHHAHLHGAPTSRTPTGEQGPSARLRRLLGDPDKVQVGTLKVTELDQASPMWTTRYELQVQTGDRVFVELPGGTDGTLVQRVGPYLPPEDGAEIAFTKDERDRPIWAYHHRGRLTGGSLEDHVIEWN